MSDVMPVVLTHDVTLYMFVCEFLFEPNQEKKQLSPEPIQERKFT